jgi:hypothetical protein
MKTGIFIFASLIALLLPLVSYAEDNYLDRREYYYEHWLHDWGGQYLQLLETKATDDLAELDHDEAVRCEDFYNKILKDRTLDIRIAIGYVDDTVGKKVVDHDFNYGFSPSMDLGIYYALSRLLTEPCRGNLEYCGFAVSTQNPNLFTKHLRIHGENVLAKVEIHFSSMSEFLEQNLGVFHSEQETRSVFLEKFFVRGISQADAFFYIGHSREGGGPDFRPPVFIPGRNAVNYDGYYLMRTPGLKRMVRALSAPTQAPVIAIMSCDSKHHFLKDIHEKAPQSGVISTTNMLNIDELSNGTIGGVDALLRGQCEKSFYESLRMNIYNQKYFTMDYMFQ